MSANLLPCPFCGGEPCPNTAIRTHADPRFAAGHVWYIACCMVQTEDFASYEAAVEAWNRRSPTPAQPSSDP